MSVYLSANQAAKTIQAPPPNAPQPQNSIDAATEKLARLENILSAVGERLQNVVARAFGPEPQSAAAPTGAPPTSGSLSRLGAQIERLEVIASSLHGVADRIDVIA